MRDGEGERDRESGSGDKSDGTSKNGGPGDATSDNGGAGDGEKEVCTHWV